MKDAQSDIRGLPFKNQLFGGFSKTDVIGYIEDLVAAIDTEYDAVEKEKQQLYELMKNSQKHYDNITLEAQKKAYSLLEDAQKKADKLLADADNQIRELRDDHETRLKQSQTDVKKLASVVTRQQKEVSQTYDQLLNSVFDLLHSLGGE